MYNSPHARIRSIAFIILFLGLFASSAAIGENEKGPVWTPPKSEKWDWLHLNSGEWLKGEIDYMRDRKIRFDSDELDDLDIDLGDCQAIYMHRVVFLRTESGDTPQGRGVLRGDVLQFETVDGQLLEIPRNEVVSIVPGGDHELDYWSFLLGVDYGMKDGNTEQVDLSGRMGIHRRTATLRFQNDYRGVYGSQDGQKTTNSSPCDIQSRHFPDFTVLPDPSGGRICQGRVQELEAPRLVWRRHWLRIHP